jgi:N-acetylmuramoyl-L-alanine amidase
MGLFQGMGGMYDLGLANPNGGDFPSIPFKKSPNQSERTAPYVKTLVWHYTAGPNLDGAVAWLCNPAAAASAHFVIGRDGKIVQLVNLSRAAWHAGNANVGNGESIGVELVNPGIVRVVGDDWVYDEGTPPKATKWKQDSDQDPLWRILRWPDGTFKIAYWPVYTPAQVSAMKLLVSMIERTIYKDATKDMRGHEDIALPVGRKTDPGPMFPWTVFAGRYPNHKTTVLKPADAED